MTIAFVLKILSISCVFYYIKLYTDVKKYIELYLFDFHRMIKSIITVIAIVIFIKYFLE